MINAEGMSEDFYVSCSRLLESTRVEVRRLSMGRPFTDVGYGTIEVSMTEWDVMDNYTKGVLLWESLEYD